ncbi:MAG TPA: hypothetical protein VNP20_04115 [Nocardioidaceae bacterium]|nr:hypothetical protein [Nocardioidaceae bacterium]
MSNVVSPRGPLPPKVYWRRRLVTLAVLVGIVLLVGRMFGGDDTEAAADREAPGPSAPATPAPKPSTSPDPTAEPTAEPTPDRAEQRRERRERRERRRAVQESRTAEFSGPAGPLAQPAGACEASEVVVTPDVEDTDAFAGVPLRVGLSANGDQACTFAFGPDTVALRVTSGDDLIWESLTCESALEEQSVVVRPAWLTYVEVDWSGRRAGEGCGETGDFAEPGYYWAEAASLGGEPQRSQFELETPPKPEPTEKPSEKPTEGESAKPGDDPGDDGSDNESGEPAGEEQQAQGDSIQSEQDGAEDPDQAGASPQAERDGEQQQR